MAGRRRHCRLAFWIEAAVRIDYWYYRSFSLQRRCVGRGAR